MEEKKDKTPNEKLPYESPTIVEEEEMIFPEEVWSSSTATGVLAAPTATVTDSLTQDQPSSAGTGSRACWGDQCQSRKAMLRIEHVGQVGGVYHQVVDSGKWLLASRTGGLELFCRKENQLVPISHLPLCSIPFIQKEGQNSFLLRFKTKQLPVSISPNGQLWCGQVSGVQPVLLHVSSLFSQEVTMGDFTYRLPKQGEGLEVRNGNRFSLYGFIRRILSALLHLSHRVRLGICHCGRRRSPGVEGPRIRCHTRGGPFRLWMAERRFVQ